MKKTPENFEKCAIKEYLKYKGVFFYNNLAGLGVFPGIPDITAIKDGRIYQIEVKAKNGRQSDHQKNFQREWEENGGCYIIGGIDEVMKYL
jgi:Holliday junction resolvase